MKYTKNKKIGFCVSDYEELPIEPDEYKGCNEISKLYLVDNNALKSKILVPPTFTQNVDYRDGRSLIPDNRRTPIKPGVYRLNEYGEWEELEEYNEK